MEEYDDRLGRPALGRQIQVQGQRAIAGGLGENHIAIAFNAARIDDGRRRRELRRDVVGVLSKGR